MVLKIRNNLTNGPWIILRGCPETTVTICWTTAKKKESVLLWGESETDLPFRVISRRSRLHVVTINSLSPGMEYYYCIQEDFPLFGSEKIFRFRTAPGKDSFKGVEFIVAGDLQPKNYETLKTNRDIALQIVREDPDFIVQTGDLVQLGSFPKYWNYLMKSLPLMASSSPVLPAIGNHEYYLFHNNKKFRSFFPYNFSVGKSACYSKDIASLHIVMLDPYDGGPAGMRSRMSREQKKWLTEDLEKAVRRGSDWIFVILHQAVLSNGEYPGDIKLQKWLIPVLAEFNVDAVFWGHAHLYEHWQYQYGENGFLLNPEDRPGGFPVEFFCIGSSGAALESNYKLFSHKPFKKNILKWFSPGNGRAVRKNNIQFPWNRDIFFEGAGERHYYHFPFNDSGEYSGDPKVSYNTGNKWFGYQYGENTLHYAKVVIKESLCTISVHYPDGTLLTGPGGGISQKFYLKKKMRRRTRPVSDG